MARQFDDASNERIDYGDVTFLDSLTTFSGSAWIYLHDVGADHYIMSKYNGSNFGFLFSFDDVGSSSGRTDTFTIFVKDASSQAKVEGATNAASINTWIHVAFTCDMGTSGVLDLWVDQVKDANSGVSAQNLGAFPNNAATLAVGIKSDTTSAGMDGAIVDPALWNRILTDDEIKSLGMGVPASRIKNGLLFNPSLIGSDTDDPVSGTTGTATGTTWVDNPRFSFRKKGRIFIPAAGGTTYEVSLSLAKTLSQSQATATVFEAAIGLGKSLSQTQATLNTYEGQTSLGKTLSISQITETTFEAALSLSKSIGLTTNGGLQLDASLSLGKTLTQTQTNNLTITGSISLGTTRAITEAVQATYEGQLNLSQTLALSAIAQYVAEAGLSFDSILDITFSQTGASASAITPDSRILAIQAEDRTLTVESEDRIIVIEAEDRIIQ